MQASSFAVLGGVLPVQRAHHRSSSSVGSSSSSKQATRITMKQKTGSCYSRTSRTTVVALARPSTAAAAAATSAAEPASCSAWKGDTPPQSSLPLKPDGSVDYSSIDASPISKVLISTIRGLLVAEVGKDTDPR
jgi:hypothetical protein